VRDGEGKFLLKNVEGDKTLKEFCNYQFDCMWIQMLWAFYVTFPKVWII